MLYRALFPVILFVLSPTAFAQAVESCRSIAADPDGDGFGWENNQSCRVTENSRGVPEFTNLETGQPVNLVRAFWTAADFNGFFICWKAYFDGAQYSSVRDATGFRHSSLSSVAPYVGDVEITAPYTDDKVVVPWSVDYGVYTGPAEVAYSPWVEVVDLGVSRGSTIEAVRVWTSDSSFYFCTNPSPVDSFIPSGAAPVPDSIFNGQCIDTAPVGDGWGWDGASSCQI